MIEPVNFGFNPQTAVNNYFQTNDTHRATQEKALAEFNAFVDLLRNKGISVFTVKDTESPHTPDSIFPNNWVSFHKNGTVCLYPMFAENRRLERREDILKNIEDLGFMINEIVDYSPAEKEGKFLESTGSMILDHDYKIAYGTVSLRLDEELFRKWCAEFNYKPVVFHANQTVDGERLPIYHTNVMMCVGSHYAVICMDSIDDPAERELVDRTLSESKKEIITITEEQMNRFAGNMLEVRNDEGKLFLVMSDSAYRSLTPDQIRKIEAHAEIIHPDLHTIETNGGGSARCMMAEIFLPRK